MKTIFHNFLDLFFPSLCAVCKERLSEGEEHICTDCLLLIPKTNFHLQPENREQHQDRHCVSAIPEGLRE